VSVALAMAQRSARPYIVEASVPSASSRVFLLRVRPAARVRGIVEGVVGGAGRYPPLSARDRGVIDIAKCRGGVAGQPCADGPDGRRCTDRRFRALLTREGDRHSVRSAVPFFPARTVVIVGRSATWSSGEWCGAQARASCVMGGDVQEEVCDLFGLDDTGVAKAEGSRTRCRRASRGATGSLMRSRQQSPRQ
jgi:hypothetical protein